MTKLEKLLIIWGVMWVLVTLGMCTHKALEYYKPKPTYDKESYFIIGE